MLSCGVSNTFAAKRKEREQRLHAKPEYDEPLTNEEINILNQLAETTIAQVREGKIDASQVVRAYEKQTVKAQEELNCVTEVMFADADKNATSYNRNAPLAGFPVSFKDTVSVAGYDSSMGYAKKALKPAKKDSPLVRLLKNAGAIPLVKTNVPLTLLSFESYNDMWGTSENPRLKGYTPGGSTGGEAALLAFGGSRLGIGTDVAGSVRIPAHFSGIYTIKCSTQRFPKAGNATTMPGQEGIPAVYSPMTRTLDDLSFFLKTIIGMKPWEYDYTVINMPWRSYIPPKTLKVGVWWSDGVVRPSPACERALKLAVDALKKKGHNIVSFSLPDPEKALKISSQLLMSDSAKIALRDLTWSEHNDAGVARAVFFQRLPWIFRKIYELFVRYVLRDDVWADLLDGFTEKSITERWDLVYERENYRARVFDMWKDSGIDILLTVPNATPAFPHKGLYNSFSSTLYTFAFNLLDYSAGILPVTRVDPELDQVPKGFVPQNAVEQGAYMNYDASKMGGLPVGVEVVGQRLEEEKVLRIMKLLQEALSDSGVVFEELPIQ